MKKSAMGAFRSGKNSACIIAAAAVVAMVSGCQSVDATKTNSVIKPVVHSVRKPVTGTIQTTERAYALEAPPRVQVRTPAPVKVSYNPGNGGTFLGSSPYICSPSGFGQRASCRPRYS